jgi:hypothetical protein
MSLISEAIESHHLLDHLGGTMGGECIGSKYHSPTPLKTVEVYLSQVVPEIVHGITPDADKDEVSVWLCRTCADNLRVYALLMVATQGGLAWVIRREFGNRIRDLGQQAWLMNGSAHA